MCQIQFIFSSHKHIPVPSQSFPCPLPLFFLIMFLFCYIQGNKWRINNTYICNWIIKHHRNRACYVKRLVVALLKLKSPQAVLLKCHTPFPPDSVGKHLSLSLFPFNTPLFPPGLKKAHLKCKGFQTFRTVYDPCKCHHTPACQLMIRHLWRCSKMNSNW